jgi:hypothetical protein
VTRERISAGQVSLKAIERERDSVTREGSLSLEVFEARHASPRSNENQREEQKRNDVPKMDREFMAAVEIATVLAVQEDPTVGGYTYVELQSHGQGRVEVVVTVVLCVVYGRSRFRPLKVFLSSDFTSSACLFRRSRPAHDYARSLPSSSFFFSSFFSYPFIHPR